MCRHPQNNSSTAVNEQISIPYPTVPVYICYSKEEISLYFVSITNVLQLNGLLIPK